MRHLPVFCFFFTTMACGLGDGDPDATAIAIDNDGTSYDVRSAIAVGLFVEGGTYKTWIAEPLIHDSVGPHDFVRTFFNDAYYTARKTKSFPMPVGATAVKEIYNENADLKGYAVAVKTKASEAAESWTWWEGFLPDVQQAAFFGAGEPGCENCHGIGKARDRSLTPEARFGAITIPGE